jgi:hypothetical protein
MASFGFAVKRALEWSKIIFGERRETWEKDRKALSEGTRVFSDGEYFSAARSAFSGVL